MPARTVLNTEQEQLICQSYIDGISIEKLARKFHIYESRVTDLLKFNQIFIRTKYDYSKLKLCLDGIRRIIGDEDRQTVIDLHQAGYSLVDIGKQFGVGGDAISKYLKNIGVINVPLHITYECDREFFESIDSESKAYILGLIIADGTIANSGAFWALELSSKDDQILIDVRTKLNSTNPIHYFYREPSDLIPKITYRAKLSIGSVKMVKDLTKYGVGAAKSFTIQWPNMISSHLLRHVLRGVFDGDGDVGISNTSTKHNPRWRLTGNYQFLIECQKFLVDNLGLTYTKLESNKSIYRLGYNGRENCRKLYHFMYDDATIWLHRKRDILDPLYK